MKRITFFLLAGVLTIFVTNVLISQDQNVKSYFKTGKLYIESEDYESGIENMTEVILIDPTYLDAYLYRAKAYEMVDSNFKAIDDLNNYVKLSTKDDYEAHFDLARLNNEVEDYKEALKNANIVLNQKKSYLPAYHERVKSLIHLERFEDALTTSDDALKVKKTKENYFYKALVLYLTENYKTARDNYQLAYELDPSYIDALIGKANCYYELNILVAAKDNIEKALLLNETCKECLLVRSKINYKLVKYQEAINDLSTF